MKRDVYLRKAEALDRKLRFRRHLADLRRCAANTEYAQEAGRAWLREFRAEHGLPEPDPAAVMAALKRRARRQARRHTEPLSERERPWLRA